MDWLRRLFGGRPNNRPQAQDIINRSRNWGSVAQDLRNAGFNPTQFDAQLRNKFQPRPQPQQPQGPHLNIQAFAKGLQDFVQKPEQRNIIPAIGSSLIPGSGVVKLALNNKTVSDAAKSFVKEPLKIPGEVGGLAAPAFNLANNNPIQRNLQTLGGKSVGKSDQRIKAEQARQAAFNQEVIRQAMGISNNMVNAVENAKQLRVQNPNSLVNQGARMAGGLAANIGLTVAAPGAAPVVYGAQGGGASAQSTYNQTGNINKATATAIPMAALNAALQKIAVDRYIHPSNAVVKNLVTTPAVQGLVGAGSQFGTNLVNNKVVDKRQGLMEGVPQAALTGAAVGALFGTAAQLKGASIPKPTNVENPTPGRPAIVIDPKTGKPMKLYAPIGPPLEGVAAATPTPSKAVGYDLNPTRNEAGKYANKNGAIQSKADVARSAHVDNQLAALKTMNASKPNSRAYKDAVLRYNQAEDAIRKIDKGGFVNHYQNGHTINDNYTGPLDSRPAHQVAIENAINKGDIKAAQQIVAQIPKNDPYRVSMEKFVNEVAAQSNVKSKPIYDNYTGPLKPEKGKKVDKIAEALGMTQQQVNEASGKSAPGLSIKDTNTLKKLGYTADDFANLKPGELKLALQKGLARDQVYKGLSVVPDLTTPKGPGEKPRGFVSSLNKDILFPREVSGALPQGYKPITNKQTVEQARRLVDADPAASLSRFLTKPKNEVTAVDQAVGQIHLRRAIDTENTALATRLIGKIDPNAREAGRTVQILAAWKKTTPEGALSTAHKIVDEANAKLGKNKQLTLSADAQKRIVEIAKNIQKFEVGTRERQVQEALLQKELAGIVPAGKLRKISTLQTLGQLLNPKTAIRNIGGNSFLAGTENVSQSIATPLDAILGKFTKQRSVVLPKLGQELKGAKIGAQYGAEDVKLGIKSQGAEGQYSLHPDIFKKGSLLNKAEKLMGYELSVPDKAFYTAAYNESLANQVAAANKTGANLLKPTAQMKLQAESEGLYRTFQNDSKLAGWLSSAKHGLNAGKDFGMGDLILKYPRTPGNIVSVGIDYAGGGAVKGVNKLVHNWGNLSPETQRQAVMDISRSITGLGMAGGAYILAKEGIIKGKQNKDKDIASAEKGMGQGPYTINLSALARKLQGKPTEARPGDLTTNYDWIQPNAINAAIGANMASKTGTKQGIANIAESLNQGVSTVVDQPVMQGLARLASKMAGQQGADPVGAIADAVKGAPASFVPSLLNQVGQLTDKPSRNTYSPSPIQEAVNMVKAKIPGLRTTLNPRYDTLGQAQQLYESNNPFNVFLNPAFINHYKNNPVIDEVRRLEQTTSETSQYPRLVNTSQTINGQNRKLTSDELAKWQKGLGELTNNQLSAMIQTPAYQKLSDPDKVKAIQNALTSFNQITKNTIFGGEKLSKTEQAVASGGNYAIKEKQPPKAKKAKKLKAPKKATGGKRTTSRRSSGRVAITKPPALHLSKLSIGRSPSIKSVKLKSTAKLVSPRTSSKKITIKA